MPEHVHRWMRYGPTDPEAGAEIGDWNHWCADGDTDHHDEPCADAASHEGEHANDVTAQDAWPKVGV